MVNKLKAILVSHTIVIYKHFMLMFVIVLFDIMNLLLKVTATSDKFCKSITQSTVFSFKLSILFWKQIPSLFPFYSTSFGSWSKLNYLLLNIYTIRNNFNKIDYVNRAVAVESIISNEVQFLYRQNIKNYI